MANWLFIVGFGAMVAYSFYAHNFSALGGFVIGSLLTIITKDYIK